MYEGLSNGEYVLKVLNDLFARDGETRHQTSKNIRIEKAKLTNDNLLVFSFLDGSTVTITYQEDSYKKWIDKRVYKKSSEPFKSGSLLNTVNAVIEHPVLKIPAFTFVEDASVVECCKCELFCKFTI